MGLDGCGKCMKFTMFAANLLILIGGITVIAVGSWICADKNSFEKLIGSNLYMSAAYILIVTGIIVVIISIIGCLGAVREIKCLLVIYFIIMFCMFVIMLVGGILGAVFRSDVRDKMKNKMKQTLRDDYGRDREINETWDMVQRELQCCGLKEGENSTDPMTIWQQNPHFGGPGQPRVPESCCKRDAKDEILSVSKCTIDELAPKDIAAYVYTTDCYEAALEKIGSNSMVLGGVGIGIACVLVLGMVFSMVLCKMIE